MFTGNKQKTRQLITGFTFSTHSKLHDPQYRTLKYRILLLKKCRNTKWSSLQKPVLKKLNVLQTKKKPPLHLGHPKVNYRVHKRPICPYPQANESNRAIPPLFNAHFNVILPIKIYTMKKDSNLISIYGLMIYSSCSVFQLILPSVKIPTTKEHTKNTVLKALLLNITPSLGGASWLSNPWSIALLGVPLTQDKA